jgi:hypothetical protein
MKVIGTGNPELLTLRLRERELAGLKEDLGHRAAVADDSEVTLQERGFDASVGDDGRTSAEILAAVTGLLDRLATAQPNEQGRVVVSGPTWLLGPAIRGATAEAAERLVGALERFISSEGCAPVELRDAVSTASAWSETLIGYDHVQNGDAAA